jgi:hypothetical protein
MPSIWRHRYENDVTVHDAETEETMPYSLPDRLAARNRPRHIQIRSQQRFLRGCQVIGFEKHGDVPVDRHFLPMYLHTTAMQPMEDRGRRVDEQLQIYKQIFSRRHFFFADEERLP